MRKHSLFTLFCLLALLSACQGKIQPTNTSSVETTLSESTNSVESNLSSTAANTLTQREPQVSTMTSKATASQTTITQVERTTRLYPDRGHPVVRKNSETIMQKFGFLEPQSFEIAKKLYSIGIEEIVSIEIAVDYEHNCDILIQDSAGEVYFAGISKMFKSLGTVMKGGLGGEVIYSRY